MSDEAVVLSVSSGIATVAINRPKVMNAVSAETLRQLRRALRSARENADIRAVLLTGQGRAFCTGADLSDPEISLDGPLERRAQKLAELMRADINPLMEELLTFPKPTLAAVNGPAVGGGIGLALCCDVAIATESAYFMQVFTPKLALVPDMGVTWLLERLVGRARTRGLALFGDRMSARQAAEWGLVWKTVADADFNEEIATAARRLADLPPLAARSLKKILDQAGAASFREQLAAEAEAQYGLVSSQDAQEAVMAFREKRPPLFSCR